MRVGVHLYATMYWCLKLYVFMHLQIGIVKLSESFEAKQRINLQEGVLFVSYHLMLKRCMST